LGFPNLLMNYVKSAEFTTRPLTASPGRRASIHLLVIGGNGPVIHMNLNLDLKLGRLPEATEPSSFALFRGVLQRLASRQGSSVDISLTRHVTHARDLSWFAIEDDGLGLMINFDIDKPFENGHFGLLGNK